MLAADLRPKRIVTDLLSLATPRRLDANASCEGTFWQLNGKIKALLVKLGRLSLLDAVAGKVTSHRALKTFHASTMSSMIRFLTERLPASKQRWIVSA